MAALDFDDRQTQIDAENQPYHPYEYQADHNESWAGALPVKQYVHALISIPHLLSPIPHLHS